MTTRRWSGTGILSRGPTRADCDFDVVAAPIETVISSDSSDDLDDEDAHVSYRHHSDASVKHEWALGTINTVPPRVPVRWVAVNPEVATINQSGATTLVGDGVARFIAKSRLRSVSSAELTHNITGGTSANVFLRFLDGTLERHIELAIDGMIAGKSFDTASPTYINRNGTIEGLDPEIRRNPDSWCAEIDLTGIAVWNDKHPWACEAKAITPRHCVLADHWRYGGNQYLLPAGTVCKWVTADNQIVTRTVIRRLSTLDRNINIAHPDLALVLLDEDLPDSITPIKLPPQNMADYMPSLYVDTAPQGSAGVFPTYNPELLCAYMSHRGFTGVGIFRRQPVLIFGQPTTDELRLAFFAGGAIVGDSGCSEWVPVNGVAMHMMQFTSAASGPNFASNISGLNALIALIDEAEDIDTGYEVETVDLTGFP